MVSPIQIKPSPRKRNAMMARCKFCQVEFDTTQGTSSDYCPQHCPLPPSKRPPAESKQANGNVAVGIGCIFLILSIVLLFTGHFVWFLIPFFVAMTSFAGSGAATSSASSTRSQNMQMICPHCQTKGSVRTNEIERKVGVSGGKATGAILTGGISLLLTGLSRKESVTQAHCGNCGATWIY
jgi:transcription elongation factor Elf1